MLRNASSFGLAAAAAILQTIFTLPTAAAGSPLGIWLDDKGRGAIEITECGGALCGKVVWVKSASDAKGCGAQIIGGVKQVGSGSWDKGWIYSPEHDRKFDVALAPVGSDRLRVTGYAGIKFLSEEYIWTRAPANLVRCDRATTAAKADAKPESKDATKDAARTPASKTAAAEQPAATPPASAAAPAPAANAKPDSSSQTTPATADKADAATQPANAEGADKAQANAPAEAATGSGDQPASSKNSKVASADATRGKSGGLSIDKVLKRNADGTCKLDLPWVKIKFNCEDR